MSAEYGAKLFIGDVATKVRRTPAPRTRGAGTAPRRRAVRAVAIGACRPTAGRGSWACVGSACVVILLGAVDDGVRRLAQFLSKYGESGALLKDPSWTKDPAKAEKGANLDALLG